MSPTPLPPTRVPGTARTEHVGGHVGEHAGEPTLPPAPALTPRERLILRTLDEDRTLAEIAAGLYVSRNTVKTQVQSLYRKLGVSRRADAVAAGHDLRLS